MSTAARVREATAGDLALIQWMLYLASQRPGSDPPPFESSLHEPRNMRFWRDWPRDNDIGVVAEEDGRPVGAAWARHFSGEDLWPWDDPAVPVLVMAVEAGSRGKGIGKALLEALIARARERGEGALDLLTGTYNEVAINLYLSCGFERVRSFGLAVRMRLALTGGP
jgi:GNAT superfamily N-acetyltransferase